jgi:hypothetical protein
MRVGCLYFFQFSSKGNEPSCLTFQRMNLEAEVLSQYNDIGCLTLKKGVSTLKLVFADLTNLYILASHTYGIF